jgi:Protein of unknown function (DUF1592)/Protein of unknown function (DUF1588)/Protein of unknown function (DUF1585)/Protein of unknown function (DUF1587)/Protein of unknown function (DUF1595)
MRPFAGFAFIAGAACALSAAGPAGAAQPAATSPVAGAHGAAPADWALLGRYCVDCHNTVDWAGGFSLDAASPEAISADPGTWEKLVRKMRTGMMPPPGKARPTRAQAQGLARFVETRLDDRWSRQPNPGAKTLHRLNRSEFANAIRDLLRLDVDVSTLLPADDAAEGFDNMADVLGVSPTLIQSYVSAAMKISRASIGDPRMASVLVKFPAPGGAAQRGYVEGLPMGTRGGMRIVYNFPLDAEYEFRVAAGGGPRFSGPEGGPPARVDVTLNGNPVTFSDPRKFRVHVPAGPQVVTVAMVDRLHSDGVDELYAQATPRRDDVDGLTIQGPFDATGPGDTPSRREVFVCKPASSADELPCARKILAHLARGAFRVDTGDDSPAMDELLQFYAAGSRTGGFEAGIQQALARILVDPRFLYRIEADRPDLAAGSVYRITDDELASRLSFFVWSSIPDAPLRELAQRQKLHEPKVLDQQVRRMLADPRASALAANFAGQWLHLRELDNAQPLDRAFDGSLRAALVRETQMLFASVQQENRSVVDLLDCDYTFLNERLARHYGIDGVHGTYMRRVSLPKNSPRRGLLGQGSILTVTSAGNRTSPVARGAWVLQTLLGAPVPQPPPGVEADLKEVADASHPLSVRERLEGHRANPTCASCHRVMDPIGFSMENFDLIGRWRDAEAGVPVNSSDRMADGTQLNGVVDLRRVLVSHADDFVTTVSEKLLQYALGRRLEYYDQPAVRGIVQQSRKDGHTVDSLVLAVVHSAPFQMRMQQSPVSVTASTGIPTP